MNVIAWCGDKLYSMCKNCQLFLFSNLHFIKFNVYPNFFEYCVAKIVSAGD